MDELEAGLEQASQSLSQFVSGPGQQAADALEQAFARAGQNIEQSLSQAAQSGELDFQRMARTILSDLAQVLAEALIAQSGLSQVGQTLNLNMSVNGSTPTGPTVGFGSSIATMVAAAAVRGARFV